MKYDVGDRIYLNGSPHLEGTIMSVDRGWKNYKVQFDRMGHRFYELSEMSLTPLVVEPDETEAFFV